MGPLLKIASFSGLLFVILLVSIPVEGNDILGSLEAGTELIDVVRLPTYGGAVVLSHVERGASIVGMGMERGPMTVMQVRKGEKSQNIFLKSFSGVKATSICEATYSGNANMLVVGEYQDEMSMCNGGMTIKAKEGSQHGISGFWSLFPLNTSPTSSNLLPVNLCPSKARSIRPSGSSGGDKCKIHNLKTICIPSSQKTKKNPDTSSTKNLVALRMTDCSSADVLSESQQGFGLFALPRNLTEFPSGGFDLPAVLFTSDGIDWTIEVMEVEESGKRFPWHLNTEPSSNGAGSRDQPQGNNDETKYHRIWVGGSASPLLSGCVESNDDSCQFKSIPTTTQPEATLKIHKRGVWFGLILVNEESGSAMIKQIFFIPDRSHAISLSFHSAPSSQFSAYDRSSSETMTDIVSFITQEGNDIYSSSIPSIPSTENVTPTPTPIAAKTFEPNSIKLIPFADPRLPSESTILHISSFIAPTRTIKPSSSGGSSLTESNLPPSTSGAGLVVTRRSKSQNEETFFSIAQLTPVIISSTAPIDVSQMTYRPYWIEHIPLVEDTPTPITSSSSSSSNTHFKKSPIQSTSFDAFPGSSATMATRKTFVVQGLEGTEEDKKHLFGASISSLANFIPSSFVSSYDITYSKDATETNSPSPPIQPPQSTTQPTQPTQPQPPPIPNSPIQTPKAADPQANPAPTQPSSSEPSLSSPTPPLYNSPASSNMSSATKWALVTVAFLLISGLAYLAIRYYLNRRVAALEAAHYRHGEPMQHSASSAPSDPDP